MSTAIGLVATDHINVEITISLGRKTLTVAELSALQADDILTLDKEVTDGVELCVGDKVIARGILTTEGPEGRLCVRIIQDGEQI